MKQALLIFYLCYGFCSQAFCQRASLANERYGNDLSLSYTNYILEHPLIFYKSFGAQYAISFHESGPHQLRWVNSLGVLIIPEVESRWVFGSGMGYRLHVSNRLFLGADLSLNYILSRLQFDRYEYNDVGEFENKGRHLHHLGPGASINSGLRNLVRLKDYGIGLKLETSLLRFDKSYRGRFFEGYQPGFSVGLIINQ